MAYFDKKRTWKKFLISIYKMSLTSHKSEDLDPRKRKIQFTRLLFLLSKKKTLYWSILLNEQTFCLGCNTLICQAYTAIKDNDLPYLLHIHLQISIHPFLFCVAMYVTFKWIINLMLIWHEFLLLRTVL